jgi:hypothetical protein
VLVLDGGQARHLGDVGDGIRIYAELARQRSAASSHEQVAEGIVASIASCDDAVADGGMFTFSICIHTTQSVSVADMRVVFSAEDSLPAFDSYTRTRGQSIRLAAGAQVLDCAIGPIWLKRGRYSLSVALINRDNNRHLYWGDKVRLVEVEGPLAAAAPYTPVLTCRSSATADNDSTH